MVEMIITARQATLIELKEKYSMRDMFDIWDIVHEELYQKSIAAEEARRRNARKSVR